MGDSSQTLVCLPKPEDCPREDWEETMPFCQGTDNATTNRAAYASRSAACLGDKTSKQQIGRTVTSVKQDEISDAMRECTGKIVEKRARKCPSVSLSPVTNTRGTLRDGTGSWSFIRVAPQLCDLFKSEIRNLWFHRSPLPLRSMQKVTLGLTCVMGMDIDTQRVQDWQQQTPCSHHIPENTSPLSTWDVYLLLFRFSTSQCGFFFVFFEALNADPVLLVADGLYCFTAKASYHNDIRGLV